MGLASSAGEPLLEFLVEALPGKERVLVAEQRGNGVFPVLEVTCPGNMILSKLVSDVLWHLARPSAVGLVRERGIVGSLLGRGEVPQGQQTTATAFDVIPSPS